MQGDKYEKNQKIAVVLLSTMVLTWCLSTSKDLASVKKIVEANVGQSDVDATSEKVETMEGKVTHCIVKYEAPEESSELYQNANISFDENKKFYC